MRISISSKLIHKALSLEIVSHFLHFSEVIQFQTVVISIDKSKLKDKSTGDSLGIIAGERCGIFSHKDVRSDTTTAIYYPTAYGMILRSGMLNAVLREEFTTLISLQYVMAIFISIGIWLLYATTRRSIIACYRKTNHRTVRESQLLLYQSLTVRAQAYDSGTVIILHCAGENLGCRGRVFIDKHYEWHRDISAPTIRLIVTTRGLATLCIYNQTVSREEFISHLHTGLKITATIIAEIDDKTLESLL